MNSLRSHLIFRLLLGIVLLFSLTCALAYLILQALIKDDFDARLLARAQALIASTTQKGTKLDIDWEELSNEIGTRRKPPNFVQFLTDSGAPWAGNAFVDFKTFPIPPDKSFRDAISLDGEKIRILTLSFQPVVEEHNLAVTPPELRQNCILIVGYDKAELAHILNQIALVLAAAAATASALSAAVILFILRRGLHTLDRLSLEVAKIDVSWQGERIEFDSLPAELIPIVEKFNDLLGRLKLTDLLSRLEASFIRERQFNANVSHELRTPVTELRTLAEVMLRQAELPDESRQGFHEVLESASRMETIIFDLLTIMRGENDAAILEISQVNLNHLILTSWKSYDFRAKTKNLQIIFNLQDELCVETDHSLLQLVLNNLFSNAVTYTPDGGTIEIRAYEWEGQTVVSVQNSSDDIRQEDLSRFFERYWRKDEAQSHDEHFGLGLSLAQVICERLQIQLAVAAPSLNSVCFTLSFPPPSFPQVDDTH